MGETTEQKRQVEIRMAELQAEDEKIQGEAEEKKKADESHIKIAQIEAAKEQAKIDKELKIKDILPQNENFLKYFFSVMSTS